jgi:hypothetical protein
VGSCDTLANGSEVGPRGGGSVRQKSIFLRRMWEASTGNVDKAIFLLIHGYIDESYNADVFALSCLLGRLKTWTGMSSAWKKCLGRWNVNLVASGRRPLSRYHAKDCSNLKNEFAGWSVAEQRRGTTELLWIFKKHPVVNMSFSVNLQELYTIFRETQQAEARFKSGRGKSQ